ncbi:MAG: NUDIX hydrolase [Dehalococcoidia bacterium]|nr:NUDIX hydrolase [Chloroflexota bacterium]MYB50381.1 NUDIX hydrolase [Dehalococcoidia bacterium]
MTDDREMFVVNTQCAVFRDDRILMIVRGEEVRHAPGVLAFPGGKVEVEDGPADILEATVRREVLEETGITVSSELKYVRSVSFSMNDGTPVVDVLFTGEYAGGNPKISDPGEVAEILWMTPDEILATEDIRPWLKDAINQLEALRRRRTRRRQS